MNMTPTRKRPTAHAAVLGILVALTACNSGTDETAVAPTDSDTPATAPVPPTTATTIRLTVDDVAVIEGSGVAQFTVTLSGTSGDNVVVDYATADAGATGDIDYLADSGQLEYAPGATTLGVTIQVMDDTLVEESETFRLVLSNPRNAVIADSEGTATIIDDDDMEQMVAYNSDWGTAGVFSDATVCGQCHRASAAGTMPLVMRYPDTAGDDISPAHRWRHTMMAHAFDDPYFQAKLQDEVHVFPQLAGLIEDKCLSCHAPMGRTHAHHTGTGLDADACPLPDGCYRYDQAANEMHARAGVSCTLCHQIKDINLGTPDSFSGEYVISSAAEPDAFSIFGPYQNPHGGGSTAMENRSGYTPRYGGQMTESDHCAACHTLYTPTIDVASGAITGTNFLEQGAYLEWKNSVYFTGRASERQCQSCHMPDPQPGVYRTRIAVTPAGTVNTNWPERTPFFVHRMTGGNTHLLEVLKTYRSVLGIETSTTITGFDAKIAATRSLLREGAAQLAIAGISGDADELRIDVRITNNTGHKLPTGYPSRRMWLHLVVTDSSGAVLFDSGAPGADGRISTDTAALAGDCLAIAKPEGFRNDDCVEPHRDTIDDPAQIALYEPVMADSNGDLTHVLLHAARYLKDNRIPPRGFTTAAAETIEPQTLPVGVDEDPDFNVDGSDTVHYVVAIEGRPAPFNVTARLLYQAVRPSFVHAMHTDAGRVNRFKVMYQEVPPVVETLAEVQQALSPAAP